MRKKIADNWNETVKDGDTVLVLGDTSWAMNLNEAKADLDIIESLPGKKIFIKGNHDYWWSSLSKNKCCISKRRYEFYPKWIFYIR